MHQNGCISKSLFTYGPPEITYCTLRNVDFLQFSHLKIEYPKPNEMKWRLLVYTTIFVTEPSLPHMYPCIILMLRARGGSQNNVGEQRECEGVGRGSLSGRWYSHWTWKDREAGMCLVETLKRDIPNQESHVLLCFSASRSSAETGERSLHKTHTHTWTRSFDMLGFRISLFEKGFYC